MRDGVGERGGDASGVRSHVVKTRVFILGGDGRERKFGVDRMAR